VLTAAALMGAAAVGAWLKYATGPVLAAYQLGKRAEAVLARARRGK
jgi:hypothetical protein